MNHKPSFPIACHIDISEKYAYNLQFVYQINQSKQFRIYKIINVMFTTDSTCDLYVFEHHSCFSIATLTEITINLAVFIKDVRLQLVYYIPPIHTLILNSYNYPCMQVTDFYNYNIVLININNYFPPNSMNVIIIDHIDLVLINFPIFYYF